MAEVKFCTKCGGSLPNDAKFCPGCGIATKKSYRPGVGYYLLVAVLLIGCIFAYGLMSYNTMTPQERAHFNAKDNAQACWDEYHDKVNDPRMSKQELGIIYGACKLLDERAKNR